VENNDKGDVAYTQAQDFMNANPNLVGIYVTAAVPSGLLRQSRTPARRARCGWSPSTSWMRLCSTSRKA